MRYSFRISHPPEQKSKEEGEAKAPDEETEPEKRCAPIPLTDELERKLALLEHSKIAAYRRSAQAIRELLHQGITTFERRLWPNVIKCMKPHSDNACDRMRSLGIIQNENKDARPVVYTIIIGKAEYNAKEPTPFPEIREKLIDLKENGANDRDRRIGRFLLGLMDKGKKRFISADWNKEFHISKTVYGNDLRRALNIGLIHKVAVNSGGNPCIYELSDQIQHGIQTDDLTVNQRKILTKLYGTYRDKAFTVEDCRKVIGITNSAAAFHLRNFADRGLLDEHRPTGRAHDYTFRVNPKTTPECFAVEEHKNNARQSPANVYPTQLVAAAG